MRQVTLQDGCRPWICTWRERDGLCLKQGEGVSPNSSKTARYFKMVVDYGNVAGIEDWKCLANADGTLPMRV